MLQVRGLPADDDPVGYDQALARVTELRQLAGGVAAPAAAPKPAAVSAAAFQQQLAMAGLQGDASGQLGAPAGPPAIGAQQLYGAMQAGGLSTQAAMLAPAAPVAPAAPTHVTGKTSGLDPVLLKRLDAVGRELGMKLDVISGLRTYDEQARLYAAYQNGTGNLAAPPGHSNHEHGGAADVYVNGVALANVPGGREASARHGLHFPVGGEAWHVERRDR